MSGPTPPEAAFTVSCTGLHCDLDATSSTDDDGSITDYDWNLGDSNVATGPLVAHDFTAEGTYAVTLTVTDDDGLQDTVTTDVTVSTAAPPLVADSFSRTVGNGWGTADVGGAWSPSLASAFSVDGSTGRVLHNAAGNGRSAVLDGISETDLTIATTISIDKPTTGSGAYTGIVLRHVSPGNEYVARLRWRSDGTVTLSLTRRVNGTETQITPETIIPGATTSQAIRLIADINGTAPTTINAHAHAIGTPDPGTWQQSTTDTSPTLQNPGTPGITTYLSSSTTNAPLTTTYDDYDVIGG